MHFTHRASVFSYILFLVPFTGTMLTKERHLKTWILFFYALMRLLMEGMHTLSVTFLSFYCNYLFIL